MRNGVQVRPEGRGRNREKAHRKLENRGRPGRPEPETACQVDKRPGERRGRGNRTPHGLRRIDSERMHDVLLRRKRVRHVKGPRIPDGIHQSDVTQMTMSQMRHRIEVRPAVIHPRHKTSRIPSRNGIPYERGRPRQSMGARREMSGGSNRENVQVNAHVGVSAEVS